MEELMSQEESQKQDERLKAKMACIKQKVLVMSGKGGVGKTSVAVNLAYALVAQGHTVGIVDSDVHGPNVAKMLGIEGEQMSGASHEIVPVHVFPNFKVVSLALLGHDPDQPFIWRGPMKMAVIKQFLADTDWGELDYLIIDAPPGTGDEPLSICQLIEDLHAAVIVTTPQDVAILDSRKSVAFAKELKIPFIGIVENMSGFVCPECGKDIALFGMGGGSKAASDLGVAFLGSIPLDPQIVYAGDTGKPFVHFNKEAPAAQAIEKILDRLRQGIEI